MYKRFKKFIKKFRRTGRKRIRKQGGFRESQRFGQVVKCRHPNSKLSYPNSIEDQKDTYMGYIGCKQDNAQTQWSGGAVFGVTLSPMWIFSYNGKIKPIADVKFKVNTPYSILDPDYNQFRVVGFRVTFNPSNIVSTTDISASGILHSGYCIFWDDDLLYNQWQDWGGVGQNTLIPSTYQLDQNQLKDKWTQFRDQCVSNENFQELNTEQKTSIYIPLYEYLKSKNIGWQRTKEYLNPIGGKALLPYSSARMMFVAFVYLRNTTNVIQGQYLNFGQCNVEWHVQYCGKSTITPNAYQPLPPDQVNQDIVEQVVCQEEEFQVVQNSVQQFRF